MAIPIIKGEDEQEPPFDGCSFCRTPRHLCKVILWTPEDTQPPAGICSTCIAKCVVMLEKAALAYQQGYSSDKIPGSDTKQ